MEGLYMLLKRFAYPCTYGDTILLFGRPVRVICMITKHILDFNYSNHSQLLIEWNNNLLSPNLLDVSANAVHRKGAALQGCFGFIDGTVRPVTKVGVNQRIVYSGHKRVHSLKFQSVVIPNGMIARLLASG